MNIYYGSKCVCTPTVSAVACRNECEGQSAKSYVSTLRFALCSVMANGMVKRASEDATRRDDGVKSFKLVKYRIMKELL